MSFYLTEYYNPLYFKAVPLSFKLTTFQLYMPSLFLAETHSQAKAVSCFCVYHTIHRNSIHLFLCCDRCESLQLI